MYFSNWIWNPITLSLPFRLKQIMRVHIHTKKCVLFIQDLEDNAEVAAFEIGVGGYVSPKYQTN